MCGRRFVIRGIKIPVEEANTLPTEIYERWILNPYSWPHPTHVYFGYYTNDNENNSTSDSLCRFFAVVCGLNVSTVKTYYGVKV